MGYEKPTPIQEMTITPLLNGRDLIGQAQTGTGKTAAFGIPMIEKVDGSDKSVQALVLSPTRELAVQTAGEIAKLAKYRPGLRVLAVYGGQPIERQLRELRYGVQIIVGTPGRVMDHLDRGTLDISRISMCVLDEADEMLDMGFREDIENILSRTNESRQTALFSATMPLPIMSLAQKYLREPEFLKVQNTTLTVDAVKQTYIQVRSFHKTELLARLLVRDNIGKALVFMNTKLGVEDVVTGLQSRGFAAAGLHGDMRQIERDAIMERFRAGTVDILIATDVAARGLDIENVEAVFNYDIPLDVEYYVHRIGRTGRAGREGRAYTFVVGRETARMWDYRKITKAPILIEQPPSGEDIRRAEEERFIQKALEIAGSEGLAVSESAKKLLENASAENVVTALLTLLDGMGGRKIHPELDIRVPEPPRPAPRPAPARFTGAPAGRYGRPAPGRPERGKSEPDRYKRGGDFRKGAKPYRDERPHEHGKRNYYDPRTQQKPAVKRPPLIHGGSGKRVPHEKSTHAKSGEE
ncbi:MAG: DEAD/DEAH box helicase [Clostridia bacterium]|nr:DEAD/DEAH box helicase [Clostridia bacterium]